MRPQIIYFFLLKREIRAIEATGHKIFSIEVTDGKLTPNQIKAAIQLHTDEHMVKPKLIYISNPSEIGSIYKKEELKELHQCCTENNLFLFLDGARLGCALCAEENDLTLTDLASLVDAFYIGGTKNGALLGEALVICNPSLKEDFRFHMKQKGALLAKGKLLGIQFLELFKDDLYFSLAKHANQMASLLRDGITKAGYPFLTDSPSNQLFPILPNWLIKTLEKSYSFYVWSQVDADHSAIRLVTSWATREDAVIAFIEELTTAIQQ